MDSASEQLCVSEALRAPGDRQRRPWTEPNRIIQHDRQCRGPPPPPATLAGAALLPAPAPSRSASPPPPSPSSRPAPANAAIGCSIAPTNAPAGTAFSYQQTNAANVRSARRTRRSTSRAASSAPSSSRSRRARRSPATDIHFAFDCTNTSPAPDTPGVNTLLLTSSAGPTPDIIAIAVAVGGIVTIPGVGGTGALAVATANVGASAPIVVTADTGSTALPLELTLCQTNPQTAQCINPTTPAASVTTQINAGETPTYTVFGKANGAIAFNPGLHRINVRFKTQAGGTVGSTSVAVQTQ